MTDLRFRHELPSPPVRYLGTSLAYQCQLADERVPLRVGLVLRSPSGCRGPQKAQQRLTHPAADRNVLRCKAAARALRVYAAGGGSAECLGNGRLGGARHLRYQRRQVEATLAGGTHDGREYCLGAGTPPGAVALARLGMTTAGRAACRPTSRWRLSTDPANGREFAGDVLHEARGVPQRRRRLDQRTEPALELAAERVETATGQFAPVESSHSPFSGAMPHVSAHAHQAAHHVADLPSRLRCRKRMSPRCSAILLLLVSTGDSNNVGTNLRIFG